MTVALFLLVPAATGRPQRYQEPAPDEQRTPSEVVDEVTQARTCGRDRDDGSCVRQYDEARLKECCPKLLVSLDAAKESVGCQGWRRLSTEEEHRNRQETCTVDSDTVSDTIWWNRLGQVVGGDGRSSTCAEGQGGKEWVGLELSLRSTDVAHPEGQRDIVHFVLNLVGDEDAPVMCEEAAVRPIDLAVSQTPTGLPKETTSMTEAVPPAGVCGAGPAVVHDGSGARGRPKCDESGPDVLHNWKSMDGGERILSTGEKPVSAVLVFDNSLSKKERAELHAQAQAAGAVASRSHGVGDARFLALTRGLEGRGKADLELTADEVMYLIDSEACWHPCPNLHQP